MAIYTTVREKLESIQKSKKESDIFPTLQMLFQTKGFSNVEITHGNSEMGKDLVFKHYDSMLGRETWFALVVKNKNAGQEVFEEGGEITRQIKLAFEVPYKDAKAEEHYINTVIVIINGSVSAQAKTILSSVMPVHFRTNIEIWNYQKLCEEIETHIRDFFLSNDGVSQDDIIVLNYKNALIKRLSSLDNAKQLFSGLNISEINDIFINVKTTISRYEAEKEKYQDTTIRHQEEPDDSITIINSNKNTIVTGIATSGKSLLLKRIGVNAVNIYKRIGVFWFRFRELSLNQFNIDQLIAEQFRSLANTEIKDEYFDRYILLFDGLDEVKSKKDRIVFIEKINQYLTHKLNTHSIISSRNIDIFDDNLFDGYEHIELLPFDIGQAFKLVKKIIPDNKSKASQFVEAIRDQQLSNTLTRTPMALTLMAILYKEDAIDLKELPANITELYNKFSDYYLDRWDATKGLSAQYKFEETKHILAFIGQYMHVRGMREIDIPQLSGFLQEIYDKFSYDELTDIQGFIEKLKNRNCLFIYNETSNTFCFNNLSFQEYFEKLLDDPKRWGKPLAALLGANRVQQELKLPSIGGKDSMSGTFENISVPPTLVSFAITASDVHDVMTPEAKEAGHILAEVQIKKDQFRVFDFDHLQKQYDAIQDLMKQKKIYSAYTVKDGGVLEAVCKMAFGNGLGAAFNTDHTLASYVEKNYGNIYMTVTNVCIVRSVIILQAVQ